MRIVYASTSRIPSRAANSIQTMRMCEALAERGHQVTLICRSGGAGEEDPFAFYGVDPMFELVGCRWPAVPGGGLLYGRDVARYLRSRRTSVDLVYARAIYGAHAAIRTGLPAVLEVHAPPGNVLRRMLEARVLHSPQLQRIVAISGALKEEYERLYPGTNTPIMVAHDAATPDARERAAAPGQSNGGAGALQVGYIGHLYPGKGVELVVRIAARMPDVDFHVVGGAAADLLRWKKAVDLPNIVFHGFVSPADVSLFRSRFDVLLLPPGRQVAAMGGGDIARWMSPLKLFEYMGSGRPIIASDLPVLREVLHDGENGLLADPDDVEAWVSAIRRLQWDVPLRNRLSSAAAADLQAEYSWARRAARVLDGLETGPGAS